MSGIINKVKEALHSDSSSAPEGTHGPHSSRAANAADPRVDSDRDGSNTLGGTTGTHGTHGTHHTTGGLGTTGTTGATYGETREGDHGPHNSRVANALDPRVDSDRDGSRTVGNQGGYSSGTTGGLTGTSGTTGGLTGTHGTHGTHHTTGGLGATGGAYGETREGDHGPHNSRVANAVDPRVDSDRDGSRTVGNQGGYSSGTTGGLTGTHGTHGTHHTHGTHAGGLDSTGAGYGAAGSGPGPAPNTAGPHKSDFLNKADPRVDSDLDGSKTVGADKTYQSGTSSTLARDPTDASQVPPSVLRQHIGDPSVEHGGDEHDHFRRNSVATHQEKGI